MEGYLERLPIGKNKNTLLRTWKQTYCKAIDGILYFYNVGGTELHYAFKFQYLILNHRYTMNSKWGLCYILNLD